MKGNTRQVIVLALIVIPVICSTVITLNLNVIAGIPDQMNDYVGGTIIPATNLLGPWIALIAILALVTVVIYQKGKNIPTA